MKRSTLSERALVVAPRGRDASIAAAILREAGFAADPCPSLAELIVQLDAGAAFVVVTEETLATGDLTRIATWLADQQEWSDLPFVLLTTGGGGLERNPAARRYLDVLGNVTFLERPFHPTTLVSLARSALRARRRQYEARARLVALRQSETRNVSALRIARLGTFDWNLVSNAVVLDDRSREIFGLAGHEGTIAQDVFDRIHPEDFPDVHAALAAASAGERLAIDYRLLFDGGEIRAVSSLGDILLGPTGKAERMVGVFADVTERVRAEAALRESERRYRTLFENIDEGFCIIEFLDGPHGPLSDYVHVEANPAYAIHAGIQEVVGQKVRDMVPAEAQGWVELYRRVLETGEPIRFERELVATGRYLELAAFRVEPESRRQVAVVFRDVTARKRAEVALRESEGRLRRLNADLEREVAERTRQRGRTWQVSPDLLGVSNPAGYFTSTNPAWQRTLGWTQDEIARTPFIRLVHPDDVARTLAAFDKLKHGKPVLRFENRYRKKDGTYRWISWVAAPEGEEFYCSGRDITAEKEQASELAARTAERDRLWTLSEDMLARADYSGMMSAVSPAWTRVLGWSETDLLTRPYSTFLHPDDMDPTLAALARMSETGQPTRFENRIATSDGGWKPIEWTVAPEADGVNFIAVGRDLSVVKTREAELAAAQDALRQSQKLEAVGQLTGGVAHDFNNLLTIIKSSTDLLRRPNMVEERRRRYVDAISETVDRAAKLTGQLLAFARRQSLKPEVFDVAERVQGITDMLRTVVGSRVQVVVDVAERCFVEADVSQFETALINMAVNARDAMDGEGKLAIGVKILPELPPLRGHAGGRGSFVAVSVADTGSGIPADKLSQIFEPFYTTKEIGKGTGLGLSQVYGFVKQSGGDVAVESKIDEGAKFTIYLPQAEGAPEEPALRPSDSGVSAEGFGRRVLVVEDNVEVGRFSTQLLEDLGYVTTWAANGAEALQLLEGANGFDVVFSDVVMPGMSGVELGEEIRRRYPSLPVVLTSGYSHVLAEEGRHGFELLQKPYAAEQLSRVLRRVTKRPAGPFNRPSP